MEHYDSVARTLMEGAAGYSPLFSGDTRNATSSGACIEGFETVARIA